MSNENSQTLEDVSIEEPKQKKNPFETENIGKLIAKFAIPCVISLLVNALYNIVDQIFIGQGVGYLGNAATNVVFPFTVIATAFALLVGDGAAAFLSIKLGEKRKEEASKGIGNAIVIAAILGVLFFAIGMIFKNQLIQLFGATDAVIPYALGYAKYIIIGLPFVIFATSMNSIIRADSSPKYAMISMLLGAIINVILDPIFIFVFHMGVEGAAIATVIGQIATFLFAILYLRRFKSITLNKENMKLDFGVSKRVLSLGISSFITQMAITIVIVVVNNSLAHYGSTSIYGAEIPLSALGIVMKVNQILISIIVGIAVGSQPIIGFNYGAKNYARVKKTYLVSIGLATIVTTIGLVLFEVFPQAIINLFGQEEGLYNEFALKCFRIFLMLCICNGFQITSGVFFQAIGKPIKAAILSLSRQIVIFIPAIIILTHRFGVEGVLYTGPVSDGLAFVIAVIFILIEMKTLHRMSQERNTEAAVESEVLVNEG